MAEAYTAKKTNLVLKKKGLERPLGPVVEGKSEQLHGNGVDAQEVPHKHHLLKTN
jgi:hypothetical protein